MSKRPLYLRSKKRSYWLFVVLGLFVAWLFWGYEQQSPLQMLVEKSSLKGKEFQGEVKEIVSDAGIKAYFMELQDSPLVAVSFIFDQAGAAYDPDGQEGLAMLSASTMTAGAGKLKAQVFQDLLRLNGIDIGFNADKDVFSGRLTAPKEKIFDAASLFEMLMIEPRFEKKYVETAKETALKLLEIEKEDPERVLAYELNKTLYGTHPYARRLMGNTQSIPSLKPMDLLNFVRQKLHRRRLFIGLAGAISVDDARKLLDKMFGVLPEGEYQPKLDRPNLKLSHQTLRKPFIGGQNIAAFALEGTCRKCEDFYPLYIANYLFGGAGLNSRLNQMMREKEGLTYGAYSMLENEDLSDVIYAGFSATPDKYSQAVSLFKKELKQAASNGFTEEELKTAKNYLTASYHLRFASTNSIAGMLSYMQKMDLGLDFLKKRNDMVRQVTLEQVNNAAKHYFGGNLLRAEIGTFEGGEK